ncbi:hypothetical protein K1719_044275 [Acacia pycnantha]|nr:hypothetical protein K1719_044275 [Acacia pycnantha]
MPLAQQVLIYHNCSLFARKVMAAFSTSSRVDLEKYDVFINFRGSDIRYGFLSHLTKQLRQEGIDVYVDERLERGDEISTALLKAIERSIIALVIFSKDYASSRWCLEELVKIMECKQDNNQIVIPIFYNVDPSHVRHQEGSYADAFTQHEQKFKDDLMKLQVWTSVFKKTAELSGYPSSNFLLIDKALVTISSDNRVGIHDLLQEMAKEIVREESRKHPERRSRLNDSKEIQDMLQNSMGTDTIEGIKLKSHGISLSADAFKKMSNLRFLKVHGFVNLPDDKLVEIHMPYNEVVKLWDGMHNLMNLKTIDLSFSFKLVELPDLSMAQNLENLDLRCCMKLRRIHPSISSLPKLFCLNLEGCLKLRSLHGDNHMKSLKLLTLNGCDSLKKFLLSSEEMTSLDLSHTGIKTLKLPIGLFNKLEELYLGQSLRSFQINELSCLTSLKIFSLSYFNEEIDKSKLVILFDAWRSLEKLYLRYCAVLEIPDNISALSLLKSLSLRGCGVESLPISIKLLSQLKEIDLGECKRLRSLPELQPSITHFYADGCTSLETIDFKVMRAIYNNNSREVKVRYPGSTIPKGFRYSQTAKNYVTIELAPSSSSDQLLGFASCCIFSVSDHHLGTTTSISRKFRFEDKEIYYKGEKEFPGHQKWIGDNVCQWYDPMKRILKETKRRFDKGTAYKFACEFFVDEGEYDHWIKGCGIWPIYASDLQEEIVEEMKLKLDNNGTLFSLLSSRGIESFISV